MTCPQGSCDSQGIQCISQWPGCQDWHSMGVLMGPCQQGKLSKCSHSFQRGAPKEPAVSLVASGGHQSCTVGLVLVPCVPGFGVPCTCTQKLVLSLAESLSLLVIPGSSYSRIPVVQSRPISRSYYKDGFYPKDGSCHKDDI